jgi:3-hydroxyisobutyrate dehydrogenase-like beta-hydroxyacid dehydrogenase
MKVGVIGLGTMGMGAALNLVRKGHQVTGCDVRETARAELTGRGTAVAMPLSSHGYRRRGGVRW